MTLDEAEEDAQGSKWWLATLRGKRVPLPENNGKPIWKYENGDLYLGGWKSTRTSRHPLEDGFGINYNRFPYKSRGLVYIGQWKDGTCHGKGRSSWIEESKTWTSNHFPASPI